MYVLVLIAKDNSILMALKTLSAKAPSVMFSCYVFLNNSISRYSFSMSLSFVALCAVAVPDILSVRERDVGLAESLHYPVSATLA